MMYVEVNQAGMVLLNLEHGMIWIGSLRLLGRNVVFYLVSWP
jgi:hypothetical protein